MKNKFVLLGFILFWASWMVPLTVIILLFKIMPSQEVIADVKEFRPQIAKLWSKAKWF